VDGLTIDLTEKGIFLVVNPDCEATFGDVSSALKEQGIEGFNSKAVKIALEGKQGLPIRIAEPHNEDKGGRLQD